MTVIIHDIQTISSTRPHTHTNGLFKSQK